MKKIAVIVLVIVIIVGFAGYYKNQSNNKVKERAKIQTQVKTKTNTNVNEVKPEQKLVAEDKTTPQKPQTSVTIPKTDQAKGRIDYINYVMSKVPEIEKWGQEIKQSSNGKSKLVVYIENEPNNSATDKYQKDYYTLYVGESQPDHTVNICRFLIHKDTKEIVVYDVVNDKYITLQEWRQTQR